MLLGGCTGGTKQEGLQLKVENEKLKGEAQLLRSQVADCRKTIDLLEEKQRVTDNSFRKTVELLEDKQRQTETSHKTDIEKLKAELSLATNAAETFRADADRKAKEDAERNSRRPGKLRIGVTYLYNAFIGSRADIGALIALHSVVSTNSLYSGRVGSDGYATITQITPGKYLCVIESQNTKGSISAEDAELITKYAPSMAKFYLLAAQALKTKTMFVEISPGEETDKTCDFGLSSY